MMLSPIDRTRLEKAATDNGFDQEMPRNDNWLGYASTQCPLRVWLSTLSETVFFAAFSQSNVADALGEYGAPLATSQPQGSSGGRTVADIPALHRLLRRAFQLSKTLPDELLHTFERETAALPKLTEAERLVVQRVGQDIFRQGLIDFWEGRCAITGLAMPELLRASHIKPLADCETDVERLDVFNGLLLAPHLDAAFDRGMITINESGTVIVSHIFDATARSILNIDVPLRVSRLDNRHLSFLAWHHQHVFRGTPDINPEVIRHYSA